MCIQILQSQKTRPKIDLEWLYNKIKNSVDKILEELISEYELERNIQPMLAKCYAASIRYLSAIGMNSGKPLLRLKSPELIKSDIFEEGTMLGFNLHASPAIGAHDRQGLERILRKWVVLLYLLIDYNWHPMARI